MITVVLTMGIEMQQPKISVIVPVYNVELYLSKCLDSLINQTLKEIEIICIDDCSTDGSLAILKEYAKRDSRVKCIEAEQNRGLGVTRNAGVEIANGDYISFVDSDDWLDLDCFEVCYGYLFANDLEVLYFGVRYVEFNYEIGNIHSTKVEDPILINNSSVLDYYLENMGRLLMMVAWNKIYKKSFLQSKQLKFHDIFYEDNDFSFRAHYYAKKYMLLPNVFYNYYQRTDSIVNTLTYKHANDIVNIAVFIKDFLIAKNEWGKYDKIFFEKIVASNLLTFSSRIINIINNLEEQISIKNLWLTKLNEHSIISEMLVYSSPYELQQMFNFRQIATQRDTLIKQRDTLIKQRDTLIKQRDTLIKQRDDYKVYTANRYDKLYYSEWASFGRLSRLGKILYLMKKVIKLLVKLFFSFIKR